MVPMAKRCVCAAGNAGGRGCRGSRPASFRMRSSSANPTHTTGTGPEGKATHPRRARCRVRATHACGCESCSVGEREVTGGVVSLNLQAQRAA
jgi:hypothetical protein